MINEEEIENQMIDDINNNCLDEIVIDTINELEKIQDIFNDDVISDLIDDLNLLENISEVEKEGEDNENKNNETTE